MTRFDFLIASIAATAADVVSDSNVFIKDRERVYAKRIKKGRFHIMDYNLDPDWIELIEERIRQGELMPFISFDWAFNQSKSYNKLAHDDLVKALTLLAQHELYVYQQGWRYWFKNLIYYGGTPEKSKRS